MHPARDRRRRQRAGPPGRRLGPGALERAARRSIAVFNPKGGVGKTTVATNLAAALQTRKGKTVLLIDADTVTGHVTTSLGIEGVRTVADSWRDEAEGGPSRRCYDIAAAHASGMRVVALTDSPLHTDVLDPARMAAAIKAARRARSTSSSSTCIRPTARSTRRSSSEADRILVPVTPGRAGHPRRRPAARRRRAGSAAASGWRWSSTGPTAA